MAPYSVPPNPNNWLHHPWQHKLESSICNKWQRVSNHLACGGIRPTLFWIIFIQPHWRVFEHDRPVLLFLFVCLVWDFLSHLDLLIYFRSLSCCITQLCLSSREWTLWSSGWVVDGFRGNFGQYVDFGSRHGSLESQSFRNSFVTLSKLIDVTDFISQPFLQIMAW